MSNALEELNKYIEERRAFQAKLSAARDAFSKMVPELKKDLEAIALTFKQAVKGLEAIPNVVCSDSAVGISFGIRGFKGPDAASASKVQAETGAILLLYCAEDCKIHCDRQPLHREGTSTVRESGGVFDVGGFSSGQGGRLGG